MIFSNANGYTLSENYVYRSPTIYSTDIFPEIQKRFEILKIPENKFSYRIEAQIIAKTFELNGIAIDIGKVRIVNFTKFNSYDFSIVVRQLRTLLIERYPAIQIEEISITPRGYFTSLPNHVKAVFDDQIYLSNKGTFYITDSEGLRRYLDYAITAVLPVLHTTHEVARKEKLGGFNTIIKPVIYGSFKDIPITQFPDEFYRFRTNLKQNQLLTKRHIEPFPLVQKNDKVIVEIKNDSVFIEFLATATQEGSLYDIITIQKSDGKRVKAKVIGEKRVELL